MPAVMKRPGINPLKQSFDSSYISRPRELGKLNISKSLNNIKSFQFSKFKNQTEPTAENLFSLHKDETVQLGYQNLDDQMVSFDASLMQS
jgi:hypothetical protein